MYTNPHTAIKYPLNTYALRNIHFDLDYFISFQFFCCCRTIFVFSSHIFSYTFIFYVILFIFFSSFCLWYFFIYFHVISRLLCSIFVAMFCMNVFLLLCQNQHVSKKNHNIVTTKTFHRPQLPTPPTPPTPLLLPPTKMKFIRTGGYPLPFILIKQIYI